MGDSVALPQWSEWLLSEIFADTTGDGRPLTTLFLDDALLARALSRGAINVDDAAARRMFLVSFPSRAEFLGWCNGSRDPGPASLAVLVLCCFAASEVRGSDLDDYRKRLQQIMGWSDPISDFSGLPTLWACLRATVQEDPRLRTLELPDPGFRTQIGHAIELTFPSRPDMAKLRTEMRRMPAIDLDSPSAVLRWLTTIVSRERFSSSFRRTFADFERAWRSGERALSDHRFWTGWTMALEAHRPDASSCPLEVVCDEWGVFQLIDATTEVPLDLASAVRGTDLPPPLRRLIRDTEPIFLVELDWGIWRWAGIGSRVTRAARAALVFEKSISRRRLVTFDLAPVTGAPGWAFTRSVEALLPWAERQAAREDDLLDIRISGPPQVDGGRLGRPAFPVVLTVSECGGTLSLAGKGSDEIDLVPSGPNVWLARAHRPLQASLRVRLDAAVGHGRVE